MIKVDLKAKPYYLSDEDIQWVENTIAGMTDEEKVGQLFMNMVHSREPAHMQEVLDKYHIGGTRYMNASPEEIYEQNKYLQEHSKIPLLIASNCEAGGNGGVTGGTPVSNGAATGATGSEDVAYEVGRIGGIEASALGCNWNFAPIVDILYNWRNTVVQMRAFGNDPEEIIRLSKAFNKGTRMSNVATCAKHFPGDGDEENDQHLMMGLNNLSCEEWDKTFGKVYQELIDDGLMTIMAGHIALPSYSKKLRPGLEDKDILPATLAPELITDLLKGQLHFNGLVVTDASHMIGMFAAMPRSQQVPRAIAAGCDMYLFFNDYEEDFGYMLDGYRSGMITEERMTDALRRILGTKAALHLHTLQRDGKLVPPKDGLRVVGCAEHHKIAAECADKYITLVKDTQKMLPLDPAKHKRIKLIFITGSGSVVAGKLVGLNTDQVKEDLIRELTAAGFEVTDDSTDSSYAKGKGKMSDFHKNFDAVVVALDVSGFAQYNALRMNWAKPTEQPWYVSEVPTLFISFNLTNHLIDLTMSKTYVNAYMDSPEAIHAAVEKLTGKSAFQGKFNDNVWCGRWDTKL